MTLQKGGPKDSLDDTSEEGSSTASERLASLL